MSKQTKPKPPPAVAKQPGTARSDAAWGPMLPDVNLQRGSEDHSGECTHGAGLQQQDSFLTVSPPQLKP